MAAQALALVFPVGNNFFFNLYPFLTFFIYIIGPASGYPQDFAMPFFSSSLPNTLDVWLGVSMAPSPLFFFLFLLSVPGSSAFFLLSFFYFIFTSTVCCILFWIQRRGGFLFLSIFLCLRVVARLLL